MGVACGLKNNLFCGPQCQKGRTALPYSKDRRVHQEWHQPSITEYLKVYLSVRRRWIRVLNISGGWRHFRRSRPLHLQCRLLRKPRATDSRLHHLSLFLILHSARFGNSELAVTHGYQLSSGICCHSWIDSTEECFAICEFPLLNGIFNVINARALKAPLVRLLVVVLYKFPTTVSIRSVRRWCFLSSVTFLKGAILIARRIQIHIHVCMHTYIHVYMYIRTVYIHNYYMHSHFINRRKASSRLVNQLYFW